MRPPSPGGEGRGEGGHLPNTSTIELCPAANDRYNARVSPPSEEFKKLTFPAGFLWGAATSTTQIEGSIQNEWTDFVARDGTTCHPACDSYHRYAEDVQWLKTIGAGTYRMGIEWSRLQSSAYGELNSKELARYCDNLDRLNAEGIIPMVVLHHFSNPSWINQSGGWVNPATGPAFIDYATKLVRALRDRVRIWNTFNEPDTYACCGYLIGQFPPLQTGRIFKYRQIISHMAQAHVEICRVIREIGSGQGPVEVGFSKNWTYFHPYRHRWPWDNLLANFMHAQFNSFVLDQFLGGKRRDTSTFLGVNYYGRIRFHHLRPLLPVYGFSCEQLKSLGVACDDMLERHPDGLEAALVKMNRRFDLPVYLTEHGSASDDEDFRARDLKENLISLHRAIEQGVDVRGFYYWSLLDNFEWQFGYTKKFGLVAVDFEHPELPRTLKPLGKLYATIAANNGFNIGV